MGGAKLVAEKTVQRSSRGTRMFGQGGYRLGVMGADQGNIPAVRALDDGSLLDGNFDDAAGQDFVLPFVAR